jgi:hypothetical protein
MLLLLLALAGAACQAPGGADYAKLPAVEVNGSARFKTVQLKTRPGVRQGFSLTLPEQPVAVALFFSGANGRGTALNMEYDLTRRGVGIAVVDPPSDLPGGFTSGERSRGDHVTDVDAVIRYLRQELRVPVWLVGMSMGSVSAASVATGSAAGVDGVVFMAPVTALYGGRHAFGERLVTSFNLERLRVPVLAVAHRQDGCTSTPPSGTGLIAQQAAVAPVHEARLFDGGFSLSKDPCTGSSYHTFAGMRSEVGDYVAAFIARHSRIKSGT